MILEFDEFELDTDRAELRSNGHAIPLEPKNYDLLRLLIENGHRMVLREEIIEHIWDGRFISEASISTAIKAARQALGDDGVAQRYIKTTRGRGFRFVGEVQQSPSAGPAHSLTAKPVQTDAGSPSDEPETTRPSIAVVPLQTGGQQRAICSYC